jgi:hypothetical protein
MPPVVAKTKFAWRGNVRRNLRKAIARLESLRKYNSDHPDLVPVLLDAGLAVQVQNMSLTFQQKLSIRIIA